MAEDKIKLQMSEVIREKLRDKHGITEEQVQACFLNREQAYLVDDREDNRTDPPTLWFIAEDDDGKPIKVCFIYFQEGPTFDIKTAYPPNEKEIEIYKSAPKRASP